MREKLSDIWFRAIVPIEAVSLFIGAALHRGLNIAGVGEAKVLPATIVESVIGTGLLIAAIAYYRRIESWTGFMIAAQVLAIAGVLLGIAATTFRDGGDALGNEIFHRGLLVTLGTGLVLAALRAGIIGGTGPAHSTRA
jgi:hypothetical protein